MGNKNSRRVIVLLVGLLLWVFYIFQEELADYGIYEIIDYGAHEMACLIPLACVAVTVGWLLFLLAKGIKDRALKQDGLFLLLLACLCVFQFIYLSEQTKIRTGYITARIDDISENSDEITVVAGDVQVKMHCLEIVKHMLSVGQEEYLIGYKWKAGKEQEAKLVSIRPIDGGQAEDFYKMGQELSEAMKKDRVVFSNSRIQITEGEAERAALSGEPDEAAEKLIRQKALYWKAVEMGYTLSEAEFEQYRDGIMSGYGNADNMESIGRFFDGCGGADRYWSLMEDVLKENLIGSKYLNDEADKLESLVDANTDDEAALRTRNEWCDQVASQAISEILDVKEYVEIVNMVKEAANEIENNE